ncbi:single-stranded DNA-binding protein [Desertifilum sp. FACHB-1129]|uniref:Single-stranded DNA-binding protein n=1 Tax=Desertifilum tharense IPPAS B-1220 TaxID=1781255 RepID=A0A1E5QRK6_9CYAN|nr:MULTISPECIES: single-stranded DNA-binding protein [Desertifilum]MDA0209472.1 single-stranded DNA-binding protein [Cyanobacteria bacterium FC1]MBD2315214.1 single-stranded DNA-binding protein [Desertifilum sp. FACHB-1129]MBD2324628.1 single-stranded DNA-binding protein [Desertifilum sp. FACHB-866]MBD2334719.1 single-stranded DNA-binding protein [Desertifilum sp. FACHB-868]OEJ77282.1 single-stranded DNA-binding protein [Desertifilum tharense IPPAS B-1220]
MNSCILMAEIVQEPQLRYTQDSQLEVVEMMVEFSGLRAEDPPSTLKVVGWGNLAREIQESYHQGDRVILEGRLNMNTIDRQEGFKEKRAELTVSRIHSVTAAAQGASRPLVSATTASTARPQSVPEPARAAVGAPAMTSQVPATTPARDSYPDAPAVPDEDDIPF